MKNAVQIQNVPTCFESHFLTSYQLIINKFEMKFCEKFFDLNLKYGLTETSTRDFDYPGPVSSERLWTPESGAVKFILLVQIVTTEAKFLNLSVENKL